MGRRWPNGSKQRKNTAKLNAIDGTKPSISAVKSTKRNQSKGPNNPLKAYTKPNSSETTACREDDIKSVKHEVAPSSTKMSYSKVVKTGRPRQTKQSNERVQYQTGMQKQLNSVIHQLAESVKALNGTDGSSASPTENNGETKEHQKRNTVG